MNKSMPLLKDNAEETLGYKSFESRRTPELVIAFVEPIGGGAGKAVQYLIDILKNETFKYEINPIKLSDILKNESERFQIEEPVLSKKFDSVGPNISEEAKRIYKLQQLGNELRRRKGNDYLAKKAIQNIAEFRMLNDGLEQADNAAPVPKAKRFAHIISSLKHKDEFNILKAVYGKLLFLIAVSGNYEQRVKNFSPFAASDQEKTIREKEYDILSSIDQDEGVKHGQQVRDIFYKADLFLNNDKLSIEKSIISFLGLLFSTNISSPSHDERMMFEAYSASLRSTCLSRQVGAAISDNNNELISIGWNDVPCFGGGLASDYVGNEALCKTKGKCRSKEEINNLLNKIFINLKEERQLAKKSDKRRIISILKSAGLSGLIEFSRAIHAEMEAILSAARTSKNGLMNGSIYVTTYPCENCVKHILTSGLKRVIYIEPYPKSRAKSFFPEFIVEDIDKEASSQTNKLVFSQFTGISPQVYPLLFRQTFERKDLNGNLVRPKHPPMPITDTFLDIFTIYESKIALEVGSEKAEPKISSN